MGNPKGKRKLVTITYSSMSSFLTCRAKYYYRMMLHLVPKKRKDVFTYGGCTHDCLEAIYAPPESCECPDCGQSMRRSIVDIINASFADEGFAYDHPENRKRAEHARISAMMEAYNQIYMSSDFLNYEFVAIEELIQGKVEHTDNYDENYTGQKRSRQSMIFRGKIDGLIRDRNTKQYYLFEHKTATAVDGTYLERLQGDLQIILYTLYLERQLGITISGVVYNVLEKCKLKMKEGESEFEFNSRYNDANDALSGKREAAIEKATDKKVEAYEKATAAYDAAVDKVARKEKETDEKYIERLNKVTQKAQEKLDAAFSKSSEKYTEQVEKAEALTPNINRKMPELYNEYYDRVLTWYLQGVDDGLPLKFHREPIVFTPAEKQRAVGELWGLTGHVKDAYRELWKAEKIGDKTAIKNVFYKNRTACNNYNSLCHFWPLCNGQDDAMSIDMFYDKKKPFEELDTVIPCPHCGADGKGGKVDDDGNIETTKKIF